MTEETLASSADLFQQSDQSPADESSPVMKKVSLAEKELGELRALGLTKSMSSRGLGTGSSHASTQKKKEDAELKALKGLGLASAKVKISNSHSQEDPAVEDDSSEPSNEWTATEPSPTKPRASLAVKELEELRALGLTKAVSSRVLGSGASSDTSMQKKKENEELKALRGLGLTSAKTKPPKNESRDEVPAAELADELSDELTAIDPPPAKHETSLANKELGELRALGLTKAMSCRGLETSSSHVSMQKKKEDEELKALRGLGLTSAKTKPPKNESQDEAPTAASSERSDELTAIDPPPAKQEISLAYKELGELRVLGLTKAMSSRGLETGSSHVSMQKKKEDEELKALRGLGLTSAKSKPPKKESHDESLPAESLQAINVPPATEERSLANRELGELRALGLTKTMSSRGFETGITHMSIQKRKENEELKALRGLGLTSAKTKPPKNDSQNEAFPAELPEPMQNLPTEQPSPTKNASCAEKELGELRALGLAKAVSSKGFESEWHPGKRREDEALKALKELGVTSSKSVPTVDEPATDPVEISEELPAPKERIFSAAEKELQELRARCLTKVVASKGFESEWHPGKRKEADELTALKDLGLTSAKKKAPMDKGEVGEPAGESLEPINQIPADEVSSPVKEKRCSEADKELEGLRALGLTKSVASKGFESEWHPPQKKEDEELKALRGLSVKVKEQAFTSV